MSRLAKKRVRPGPLTSTQVDLPGDNAGDDEYLSREERIFQRQLEAAIEMSKKQNAKTEVDSSKKRKSEDIAPQSKVKRKKFFASDDEDDDDFSPVVAHKKSAAVKLDSTGEDNDDVCIVVDGNKDTVNHIAVLSEPSKEEPEQAKCESKILEEVPIQLEEHKRTSTHKQNPRKLIGSSESEDDNADKKKSSEDIGKIPTAKKSPAKRNPPKQRRKVGSSDSEEETFSDRNSSSDEEFSTKKSAAKKKPPLKKPAKVTVETKTSNAKAPTLKKPTVPVKVSPKQPPLSTAPPKVPPKLPERTELKKVLPSGPAKPISMPKWNPPAKINSSPSTSFSAMNLSPGIRVGLSRNARVKPLHKNVKLTP